LLLLLLSAQSINAAFQVKWLGIPDNKKILKKLISPLLRSYRYQPLNEYFANSTSVSAFCFEYPIDMYETNSAGMRKWTMELGGVNDGDQRVPATFIPVYELLDEGLIRPILHQDRASVSRSDLIYILTGPKDQDTLEFRYWFRRNRRIAIRERATDGRSFNCWASLVELDALPKLKPHPDYRWILHKKQYMIDLPRFRIRRPGITLTSPPFSILPPLPPGLNHPRSLALRRFTSRRLERLNSFSNSGISSTAAAAAIAGDRSLSGFSKSASSNSVTAESDKSNDSQSPNLKSD
jgi:hypothetical protein